MYIDKYGKTIFEWKFSPMANYICPTFRVTRNESNAPRGLALLLSLIEGPQKHTYDAVVAERLYQCISCYLCTSLGYDDTDPASLFMAARAEVVELGLAPAPILELRDRLMTAKTPAGMLAKVNKKAPLGLVVDPFVTSGFAGELEQILGLLDKAGLDYGIPWPERGGAARLFELGFRKEAEEIAQAELRGFERGGYETLVFLSPYDFRFHSSWAAELGLKPPGAARLLPFPSLLLELRQQGKIRFGGSAGAKKKLAVTYIDAGHLVRPQSSFSGIGELLLDIPGLELRPMWRTGRLADCDSGDFLPEAYPQVAQGIDRKLLDETRETGCQVALTSCFYALSNLRRARQADDPEVEELGSFLSRRLS
jgi:Fe-S oxidoreductase